MSHLPISSAPQDGAPRLSPGDYAPDFALLDADGMQVTLMAYRGQRVVLWFPRSTERAKVASDFESCRDAFAAHDTAVLLIAPDDVADLHAFVDEHDLTIPVLADPELTVHYAFGAYAEAEAEARREGDTDPKADRRVVRTTVVVDGRGDVERVYYDVRDTEHVATLMRDLGIEPRT